MKEIEEAEIEAAYNMYCELSLNHRNFTPMPYAEYKQAYLQTMKAVMGCMTITH